MKKAIFFFLLGWGCFALQAQIPKPLFWLQAQKTVLPDEIPFLEKGETKSGCTFHLQAYEMRMINYHPSLYSDQWNRKVMIPMKNSNTRENCLIMVYHVKERNPEYGVWEMISDSVGDRLGFSTQKIYVKSFGGSYLDQNLAYPQISVRTIGSKLECASDPLIRLYLGDADTLPSLQGEIVEMLYFDKPVYTRERQQWQSALAVRNGITLHERDYLNSAGESIWPYLPNEGFIWDVIGLGKDTVFELDQKQSRTLEGRLSLSAGRHAVDNATNPYRLEEGDFLMVGSNGLDKAFRQDQPDLDWEGQAYHLIEEEWKVIPSGMASAIPTQIRYSFKGVHTELPEKAFLVQFPNGNTTTGERRLIKAGSVSKEGLIMFDSICWDTDGSGNDRFTFAFIKSNKEEVDYSKWDSIFPENLTQIGKLKSKGENWDLFPNPSRGEFELKAAWDEPSDISLIIYDNSGRKYAEKLFPATGLLHYQGYITHKGVYHVVLSNGKTQKTAKLVIR